LIIGHRSVYPDQLISSAKSSWMYLRPDLPVGEEKVHLSKGVLKWLSRYQSARRPLPARVREWAAGRFGNRKP
jgi:hypothetical protein